MLNWRKLKRDFGGFRKKGRRLFGILGNEAGIINVPDRPGYQYARIERGAERVTLICKGNARPRLNTAVIIEQNAITGEFEIVGLDVETTRAAGDDPATALFNTAPHAASHEWRADADDILLWLNPLQMYFLRVQPGDAPGHVVVQGGPYFVEGNLHWKREQSDLDLTGYYPSSGSVWVMVCLDGAGDFTIVQKAGGGNAADIVDLGPIPSRHIALAAIRLTYGAAFDFFSDFIPLWQVTQFDASVLSNGTVIIQDGTGMVIDLAGDYPSVWGEWFGLQQFTLLDKDFLALRAYWNSDFGAFGVVDEGFNRKDTVVIFGDDTADHLIIYGYASWDGETYELRPMLTIDMNGAITPYTGGTFDGVDVSDHDHSGTGQGGTVDFISLGDVDSYVGNEGKFSYAKVGGGVGWAVPGGGGGSGSVNITFQGMFWTADGPLAVADEVGGVHRCLVNLAISQVSFYLFGTGSSGSTIIDADVSVDGGATWSSLFTTPALRPEITAGASDKRATSVPDVTRVYSGSLLRVNVDQVAAGARGLSVQIDGEVVVMQLYQYTVTLVVANTEYSQALPAGVRAYGFQARTNVEIRWAKEAGKVGTPTEPYGTVKPGHGEKMENLVGAAVTLYFASATAGTVVEVQAWA